MRNRILLALLVVSLILLSVSGVAYARGGHVPFYGEKLACICELGSTPAPPQAFPQRQATTISQLRITNLDDSADITIKRVTITRGDGTLIYQGPLLRFNFLTMGREIVTELPPHEIFIFALAMNMWTGAGAGYADVTDSDNWLPYFDALEQPSSLYIVEIAWEARGSVIPLAGWKKTVVDIVENPGGENEFKYVIHNETQLVNFNQHR